jgi:signal transduction histidine kinase
MRFFVVCLWLLLPVRLLSQDGGLSADSTAILTAHQQRDAFQFEEAANTILRRINAYGADPKPSYDISLLYFELGNVYSEQGTYRKALDAYEAGLAMDRELDDTNGVATFTQRIGLIYTDMGHYKKAFDYLQESSRLAETTNDSLLISYNYHNIGVIYEHLENYDRADFHYQASLRIDSLRNDWEGVAIGTLNLGNVASAKGDAEEALRLYNVALTMAKDLDMPTLIVDALQNIATIHDDRGDLDTAMRYYNEALVLSRVQNNTYNQANILNNIAGLRIKQKRWALAHTAADEAQKISEAMGARHLTMTAYEFLSEADAGLGRIEKAYAHLMKAKSLRDSVLNTVDIQEFIEAELRETFTRKQELESELANSERTRTRIVIILTGLFVIVLLVTLVFLLIEFKRNKDLFSSLKKAEQSRSALFSIMAHDIKNPLTGIIGLSSIIQDDARELSRNEIQSMATRLNTSAQNLNRLLDSLLEWSHVELNIKRFNSIDILPYEAVHSITRLLEEVARPKNITFSNRISPTVTMHWDPYLFDSILRNLISNAIKYSYRDGMVIINYHSDEQEHIISVRDFGPGMNLDTLRMIIYDNEIVSTPGTEHELGSGLGLLLSRQIARKNGARLTFGGPLEQGTEVHLRIKKNPDGPKVEESEPQFQSAV